MKDAATQDAKELRSEFIGTLRIGLGRSFPVGETPAGARRIDVFGGGSFKGPRIDATLVSGSDCLLRRADGAMQPDVRLTLETVDGGFIHVAYRGIRHGPSEVMARIARGEEVEPTAYYLRTAIFFETGAAAYDWLNRVVAVGVGRREPQAAVYEVFAIL